VLEKTPLARRARRANRLLRETIEAIKSSTVFMLRMGEYKAENKEGWGKFRNGCSSCFTSPRLQETQHPDNECAHQYELEILQQGRAPIQISLLPAGEIDLGFLWPWQGR
jgi:hypothetical protein